MNIRIKELMARTLDKKFSYTWTAMDYQDIEVFSEQFAELIIQECKEDFAKVWYEQGMDIRGAEWNKFITRFEELFGVK